MRVLLYGGAGYIGAHVAVALADRGHEPLIIDNADVAPEVVSRLERIIGRPVPALFADARDLDAVSHFMAQYGRIDAVVHLAGLKSVGESVENPLQYYTENLTITFAVLQTMSQARIRTIVFSSSATVYGVPQSLPLTEEAPTTIELPSPYGKTKRVIEELLSDASAADAELRVVLLRYFNPVGAHPSGMIGEDPQGVPSNLMPYVSRAAAGQLPAVGVFGKDYDTPDGTGLRDYIHVLDLAAGHVAAIEHAEAGLDVFNLGTGKPSSVLELVKAFQNASGVAIPIEIRPRRAGDVPASFCDPGKAHRSWGWKTDLTLEEACVDYWRWQTQNPSGYRGAQPQPDEFAT